MKTIQTIELDDLMNKVNNLIDKIKCLGNEAEIPFKELLVSKRYQNINEFVRILNDTKVSIPNDVQELLAEITQLQETNPRYGTICYALEHELKRCYAQTAIKLADVSVRYLEYRMQQPNVENLAKLEQALEYRKCKSLYARMYEAFDRMEEMEKLETLLEAEEDLFEKSYEEFEDVEKYLDDAPSNEIDWNEVDYFDYINQKEDETSLE